MKDTYSPPLPSLVPGSRVWAYLRDSGGPNQTESVAQQESEIKTYCKKHHLELARTPFRDVAKSGGSSIGRDEFMKMIELTEDEFNRPSAILIWNFARFSRDYDDFQFFKSTLKRRGVMVHSLTDSIPVDDFAGRVMEVIISLANEEKRRQTSRDVKRGLKDLTSKKYAPGIPPRGYKAVPVCIGENRNGIPHYVSKWEPDPALSEYVKLAWELRAQGKSYADITKATQGKLYTASGSWVSFFKNKSYLGYYGKDEIHDHHEPLITQELFDAVQKRHEAHPLYGAKGFYHPRRVGNPSLLTGFTYCECGAMMTHSRGYKKNKPWSYYICGRKNRHGNQACSSRRIGANKADAQIIEVLKNKILTQDYLAIGLEEARHNMQSLADIENQLTAEKRTLEDLEISIQRLLRTIERTDSPAAQERLKQREAERAHARIEIDKLSRQLASNQMDISPLVQEIILTEWRSRLNKLEEAGDVRELREFIMDYIQKIEIGYNPNKKMTTAKISYTYTMRNVSSTSERSGLGALVRCPNLASVTKSAHPERILFSRNKAILI